jgi:3-oxoacyl-(acyl-carrier-protein) synthase
MIGQGLGAAGGLEAIASIKAINTGWLHHTIKIVKSIKEVMDSNQAFCNES